MFLRGSLFHSHRGIWYLVWSSLQQVISKSIWSWRWFRVLTVRFFSQPRPVIFHNSVPSKTYWDFWPLCFPSVPQWASHHTENSFLEWFFKLAWFMSVCLWGVFWFVCLFVFYTSPFPTPPPSFSVCCLETLRFGWKDLLYFYLCSRAKSLGTFTA